MKLLMSGSYLSQRILYVSIMSLCILQYATVRMFFTQTFFNVNLAICFVSIFNFKTLLHLMRGPRKFCQRGSNFESVFFFFSLLRRGRVQIPLLADHHWPASETSFKWRFTGGPMMA